METYTGKTYMTAEGKKVTFTQEAHIGTQYHCGLGDDGIWRYLRESDFGRVTASAFDMSDRRNIIVEVFGS